MTEHFAILNLAKGKTTDNHGLPNLYLTYEAALDAMEYARILGVERGFKVVKVAVEIKVLEAAND